MDAFGSHHGHQTIERIFYFLWLSYAITDVAALAGAAAMDNVCGRYKDDYRNGDNFGGCDCVMLDCDNDHSEKPDDWITPKAFAGTQPDVQMAIVPSRNNMKEKNGKAARPKFHAIFPIADNTDAKAVGKLKRNIQRQYPFFDDNALDATRFAFGAACDEADILWQDGWMTIEDVIEPDDFLEDDLPTAKPLGMIPNGQRNNTLNRFAGRVLKRYGECERAYQIFLDESTKCETPLSDAELKTIWNYNGFKEVHLRARLAFPSNGSGRAGVFCGDIFCCLNVTSQAVELFNGDAKIGSYGTAISRTTDSNLRGNPSTYTVEMRIRGNTVRVYSGSTYTLRFTATVSSFSGGYAGYRSDNRTVCELLRMGDAWTYEPYERFDIEFPDGTVTQYGRLSRTNAVWDDKYQVFTLTADVEESATRSEDISLDYDFYHSHLMELSCGGDYTVKVIPKDINIWISRLFLGDADGFSILYYSDVDSLVYWANEAAYRWKLRGIAIWSLGQEDMRLWEALPRQV